MPTNSTEVTHTVQIDDQWQLFLLKFIKMTSLGFLASSILHEIANSLTVISANTQIISMKYSKEINDDIKRILNSNLNQIDRIQTTMGRCNSFSSRLINDKQYISPQKFVENAIYSVQRRVDLCGVKIKTEFTKEEIIINSDPTLLEYVVLELIASFWKEPVAKGLMQVTCYQKDTFFEVNILYSPPTANPLPLKFFREDNDMSSLLSVIVVLQQMQGQLFFIQDADSAGWTLRIPLINLQ